MSQLKLVHRAKRLGLIICAFAGICAAALAIDYVLQPADDPARAIISEVANSPAPAPGLPGRGTFRYRIKGPVDHTITYWTEVRRNGEIDKALSHAYSFTPATVSETMTLSESDLKPRVSESEIPGEKRRFDHDLQLCLNDPSVTEPAHTRWIWKQTKIERKGLVYQGRWLKFHWGTTNTSSGNLSIAAPIADPFMLDEHKNKMNLVQRSSWGRVGHWTVKPGDICTLLEIRGDTVDQARVASSKVTPSSAVVVYLKVRFDPIRNDDDLRAHGGTNALGPIISDPQRYGLY